MICASCGLYKCACLSGTTRVTIGAWSIDEAKEIAEKYLARHGYSGVLVGVKRRRAKVGLMGYKAWDMTYEVTRNGG